MLQSRVAQTAGLPSELRTAAQDLRDLLDRAAAIPDAALSTFDVRVGDWTVRLRSTDARTASLYRDRLGSACTGARKSSVDLTFDLLEMEVLGWEAPASYADWRSTPGSFEASLKSLGLGGAIATADAPTPVEPFSVFDPAARTGLQLVDTVSDLPPWDAGSPFRIFLNLAAVRRGWRLVHAGTLALAGNGVLIVGPGGVGKSGTCLAGISTGLQTVGDDYVLLAPGDESVMAHRAYRVLKQDREGLARIPGLAARTAHEEINWQGKLELDPEVLIPGCTVERMQLRAIVLPVIAHARQTRFEPAEARTLLHQFAPSLWAQLPGTRASSFMFARRLLHRLPTFRMLLSESPGEIGDSVRRFIEGLSR